MEERGRERRAGKVRRIRGEYFGRQEKDERSHSEMWKFQKYLNPRLG